MALLLPGSVVVNADEIARQRWPDDPASHAYDAAQVATDTRAKLIELGRSFVAETVFSHPSKLDRIATARAGGFTVVLHALLVPEHLAVERVRHRVAAGGHGVPEIKIRQRHRRLWALVAEAIALSDIASIYDTADCTGPASSPNSAAVKLSAPQTGRRGRRRFCDHAGRTDLRTTTSSP